MAISTSSAADRRLLPVSGTWSLSVNCLGDACECNDSQTAVE
jgi:hypothetical protein